MTGASTWPICRQCTYPLAYLHGHGQCVNVECPMQGLNQDECCAGTSRDFAEPFTEIHRSRHDGDTIEGKRLDEF